MPSPTKGVPVELDKKRHLRFPLGVLKGYTGEGDLGTALADLLHRGLKHEDEELTVEDVAEIVDLAMVPDLVDPLEQATGGLVNVRALFNMNGASPEGGAEGNAVTPPGDG